MLTKTDLNQIDKIVTKRVKFQTQSLGKRLNKRFDKLERKLDYAINFLDRNYLKLLHRTEVIEEHFLGIQPTTP